MARLLISEKKDVPENIETYPTSDRKLVIGLLSLGHEAVKVEGENSQLLFYFDKKAVMDDKDSLLTGKDVQVSMQKVWSSEVVWAMCLTQLKEMSREAKRKQCD